MNRIKKIKGWIGAMACALTLLGAMVACEEDMFNKELYIKIFGLLCDDDNIFEMVHSFGEEGSERFVSVICGGTKPLEEDVTITIEIDGDSLLDVYNEREFALDTTKFAKILDASRYNIPSFVGVMEANSSEQYLRFPITVKMDGLSPDTIYFIPLRLASVSSGDTINEAIRSILYRPTMKNDYAEQSTAYTSKGYSRSLSLSGGLTNGAAVDIGVEKLLYPISENQVRLTISNYKSVDSNSNADLSSIQSYSVVITIEDGVVTDIQPYVQGAMTVELVSPDELYEMIQASSYVRDYTDDDLDRLYLSEYYRNYYNNAYRIENSRACIFLCYRYQIDAGWYLIQERLRLNVTTTTDSEE